MPDLKPCGTPAAYRRHLRHGQEPCDACREAENARNRKGDKPFQPADCGTEGGYGRHLRLREEPCVYCRAAHAAEMMDGRRRRAGRADVPHGQSGYVNWDCRCEVCTAAHVAKLREYAANRKRREAARVS